MKRFVEIFLIGLLVLVFPGQEIVKANTYHIGPRDVLTVSIFAGGEKQVETDLTVSEQGYINSPFIGAIKAAGLTNSDLEKQLYVPLERDFFVDPQIHISVKEYHSLSYSISGAVKKPGKYEMQTAATIMDLIAKAEGVTLESGNIAYIMRDDDGKKTNADNSAKGEPIKVNLVKLLDEGDMSSNVKLFSGDSVYIPFDKGLNQSESKVYVSGEVEKPALYDYNPGLTALSVCIMAGGFAKYAAPNRTTIVRIENGEQKVIKVDLDDVIKGTTPDVALKPGDRVHVPESWL